MNKNDEIKFFIQSAWKWMVLIILKIKNVKIFIILSSSILIFFFNKMFDTKRKTLFYIFDSFFHEELLPGPIVPALQPHPV